MSSRLQFPRVIALGIVVVTLILPKPIAGAQIGIRNCQPGQVPELSGGFAELKAQLGDIMGEPVECPYTLSVIGDTLQHTTTGLAVWRKATNSPGFAVGDQHWALTVNGLVHWTGESLDPPGIERLSPEPAADSTPTMGGEAPAEQEARPASTACPVGRLQTVLHDPWTVDRAGRAHFSGRVRNECNVPLDVDLDFRVLDRTSRTPLAAARSTRIENIPPGQEAPFSSGLEGLPPLSGAHLIREHRSDAQLSARRDGGLCLRLQGQSGCALTDVRLVSAMTILMLSEAGRELPRVAMASELVIRRERTPIGVLGLFDRQTKEVIIDTRLDAYSVWERAAVLAHELQHAADAAVSGPYINTSEGCFATEEHAFQTQGRLWLELWKGQLPAPQNAVQAELNRIAVYTDRDPIGFTLLLADLYGHQCG